jgi:peroxiredoxin
MGAALFAADTPRLSPEFVINTNDGGKQLLSKYRGKVVLCEFLFTTCPHCQNTAKMISKLQDEFGARGFQALGIAFNEMSNMLAPDFVKEHRPAFPVGWSQRGPVMSYLGLKEEERFVVPQIVLMDRRGIIRFQSLPLGDPNLQDEKYLRERINELLIEAGTTMRKPAIPAKPPAQSSMTVKRAPEVK